MIHVAVLGYGTVGSGVLEVFRMNQEKIDRCAGDQVRIKYILDLRDFLSDFKCSLSDVWAMGGEPAVALNIVGFPNCSSFTFASMAISA